MNRDLAEAYACCERLARSHYENFPVASRLLPAAMRPHIAAIYAFARLADDMADEGDRAASERIADLDTWEARLARAARGEDAGPGPHAEVFVALRHSIAARRLPPPLFHDLISAFRQDVTVTRYATWHDLLDYCRRSANPVGRLVLRVAGYDRADLDVASDALCTALQLTNFWQDLEVDAAKGRIYLPASLRAQAGAAESDLAARRMTAQWRAALAEAVARTRALFAAGAPVADGVEGRLRWELRATWLGGLRILEKLEAAEYDVFARRPTLAGPDVALIAWRTLAWKAADYADHAERGAADHAEHADRGAADYAEHAERGAADYADHAERGAADYADHAERGAGDHAEHAERGAADHADHAERGAADQADHAERGAAGHADHAERGAAEHADHKRGHEGPRRG